MKKFMPVMIALFLFGGFTFSHAASFNLFNEVSMAPIERSLLKNDYPFLVKDVDSHPDARVYVGKFVDQNNVDFLILRIEGLFFCGNRGCTTSLYKMNDHAVYERIENDLVINGPIYRKICKNNFSLVFSPGGGEASTYAGWQYNGVKFALAETYESLNAAGECLH